MIQEEKNIYDFKKGDIITRIKPLSDPNTKEKDFSFVGRRLIFMGLANATIYVAQQFDPLVALFMGIDKNIVQLPIELWEDGWALYVEPEFLDSDSVMVEDEKGLQEQIQRAVEADNYERAEELRKKLEKLKKKRK
ncbi:MAG TPA: UvrB/UvrC motif-containing protein [Candidatus Glassbacteria bacterium]|nr:UvrB/UvrC motif-containing protein [Candidatus Glassbacteria bacterium]